ncbi:MAG TPA: S41 family peptidase [Streptosporangiaceae bacterium]|nr:S41 family peptidase [Streptosporangiaceae bacterium]
MQQADITAITRELAGLVAERYVFPGLGADLSQLLQDRLADGAYTPVPDEESLATTLTQELQSRGGDKHLRLLHSASEVPERGDEAAERAAMTAWAQRTAGGIARAGRLDGNIGYLDLQPLLFPPSIAGEAVAAAMTLIAPADALFIDLRQCLGGDPDMVAMLCTYLFGAEPVHLIDMISRPAADGTAAVRQSWTMPFTPGRRFGPDKPVFVLTSGTTFSGGEELAYDLQQLGRATVVGERTRGGAHPVERFRIRPHLQATIPVARALSPVSGGNWEGTGVLPDIPVAAGEALDAACQRARSGVLGR